MNPTSQASLTPNPTDAIAQLVGEVFAEAPPVEKSRLLMHLMKPLGLLSLAAIANGIFAEFRFQASWPDPRVAMEQVQNVQTSDVITLVNYVQQVSASAIDSLSDLLSTSPLMTSSAAAALLANMLMQRARKQRANDRRRANLTTQAS